MLSLSSSRPWPWPCLRALSCRHVIGSFVLTCSWTGASNKVASECIKINGYNFDSFSTTGNIYTLEITRNHERFWCRVGGNKSEKTSSAGLRSAAFAFVKHTWNGGSCPRSCQPTPECCLVFHDVCGGTWLFACERSKLGALTAACLWNSSKTTLILFRLALSESSPPVWLSVGLSLSATLLFSLVLSGLFIFPAPLNYLVSLSFCCEGDAYAGDEGVSLIWREYLDST